MQFDSETLFNTAAAAVATIAVVLFILDQGFPYSPVSKSMLVVTFVAGVFAVSQATNDDQLTLLGYGVVVVATVALLLFLTGQFDVETGLQVGILLALAAVLFGLRTRLDDGSRFVSGTRGTQLFAAVAALAVLVLAVDVVTGTLAYELQPQSEVELAGEGEESTDARLGTVAVANPGPFPEEIDMPHYDVCAAGDWSAYEPEGPEGESRPVDAHLDVQHSYGQHVFGFGEKRFVAVVNVHAEGVAGEQFRVERTDACPDDADAEPYLAVFERDDDPYGTP
ncbi:MAG: hypothetical protein ACOCSD_07200, partial [Halolamina sp.]